MLYLYILLPFLFLSIHSGSAGTVPAALSTRTLSADDLMRIRANTDAKENTFVEWEGQVLSYKPGEQPKVVFNVLGMNVARAVKMTDGTYDLLSRELQLYLDPVTNRVLNTWQNSYSGQMVPVVHVANSPVYQSFPPDRTYVAKPRPGGLYTFQLSIPLSYPNPLNPTGDPNSPFFPYSGSQKLSAIESFTFTVPASELSSQVKSSPSTQVYWTRTSPLLPWMATPSTNVTLLFIANGAKVEGGYRNLNSVLRSVIDRTLPSYKEAPLNRTSPGGGVSSWSYFAQPNVFEAYLNRTTFPIPELILL